MSGGPGRMGALVQAVDVLAADPEQLLPARQMMAFTLGFHIILVPFGVAFTAMMPLNTLTDRQGRHWASTSRRRPRRHLTR